MEDESILESGITVQDAFKSYGMSNRRIKVLQNLNMSVPIGSIYGLLGPSGCGKTTLLQCIIGKQKLSSGEIRIFGHRPGSIESGIPGNKIGYMPQDLALYEEFSISETLKYFGRIFGLSSNRISERSQLLLEILNLNAVKNKVVSKLSGGQKRRTSLIVSLLHEPELLILDEPTVGVDPILRKCIWDHLIMLSASRKSTIIITTHYLEEARHASTVGLMRCGQILEENSPISIIKTHNASSLEQVFLQLCNENDSRLITKSSPEIVKNKNYRQQLKRWFQLPKFSHGFKFHRFQALFLKNMIRLLRNTWFLLFLFILPTIQMCLFCLSVGRDLQGMTIAIFNEEVISCQRSTKGCILEVQDDFLGSYKPNTEHLANLSCRFLSHLNNNVINPIFFSDYESAKKSVDDGIHWGFLHFQRNFSLSLYNRVFGVSEFKIPTNLSLMSSRVETYLDVTIQQAVLTIQHHLTESFQEFSQELFLSCGLPSGILKRPINLINPIYASSQFNFSEFMAPGIILAIAYFMAVGSTALSFIVERRKGLYDRSFVAGVTSFEMILAYMVSQLIIMVIQHVLVLLVMIYVFYVPAVGSIALAILLILLQGVCGMSFGLLISSICDTEQDAIQVALGSFYPNLLLAGILWPLEGIPKGLRMVSYILPQTYACISIRGILSQGLQITHPDVYGGFLVTLFWMLLFFILTNVVLKVRH